MPNDAALLALDAAPGVGSVALVCGREVLGVRAFVMRAAPRGAPDDDPLARAVDDVLRGAGVRPMDLGAVACGAVAVGAVAAGAVAFGAVAAGVAVPGAVGN